MSFSFFTKRQKAISVAFDRGSTDLENVDGFLPKLPFVKKVVYMNDVCIHHIQGVLLPDRQTLRGDSSHKSKHY